MAVMILLLAGASAQAAESDMPAVSDRPHPAGVPSLDILIDQVADKEAERARASTRTVPWAARVLSVHAPGELPATRSVLGALAVLQVKGGPAEVALLRDVLAHEDPLLADLARRGIADIRTRQRTAQRQAFARSLSHPSPQARAANVRRIARWRASGLGPTEARCAAYADRVLGSEPLPAALPVHDDPQELLDQGRARAALGVLDRDPTGSDALRIRAHEDAGDVRGAIRLHAHRAAAGDAKSITALEGYGIEVERLVLGLLHSDRIHEPEALETLVRSGQGLTVSVLAERVMDPPSRSDQATAADALGRMLHTRRPAPLPRAERERIRRTLWTASQHADPEVSDIARDALLDASEP